LTDTTVSPATSTPKTFSDFGIDDRVCSALTQAGITHPFPIQELTLPLALTGADLIGQARTGTGKTLAFGIPLVQRAIASDNPGATRALVIVPTRELCLQVRDDLAQAAGTTDVHVVAVYGGKSIDAQVDALREGADIVVGTPGRLLDLLRRGSLTLSGVTGLVLDEADEMLDLGFLPDVEQLIQATADQRQTLLFSATMPSQVVALARRYMNKPTFMRADVEEVRIAPATTQHFFSCHRMDKPAVLARILQTPGRGLCVVFSRTKRMADVLVEELRGQGVAAAAIHSDLRQEARERALKSFRSGKTDVLVATEVAARGLDITDVTHVVNYDCPDDEKMYLHRIGRTGRAGAAGVAITLAVWNELARLEMIKKALGIDEPTHEVFSTSPILEELFDLPPVGSRRRAGGKDDADGRDDADEGARRGKSSAVEAADADADDSAGEDDAATQRPSRARRRRGGRRGGRGRAGDRTAQDTQDGDTDARASKADGDRDGDGGGRAAVDEDGETADGADGDVIRRTRTRRRGAGGAGVRGAGDAGSDDDVSVRADGDEGGGSRGEDTASPTPTRGDRPATTRPTRTAARSSRTSTRGGRGGRSKTGSASRDQRRRSQPRSAPVDSTTARGEGQPRLTRPLVIAYLP